MSVTSSAVSTADLEIIGIGRPTLLQCICIESQIWYLVSAVESSPSARPLAKDLRAGGPGGEGGAGAIPGTWVLSFCTLWVKDDPD